MKEGQQGSGKGAEKTTGALTEKESKDFLRGFGIPVVAEKVAGSQQEAVEVSRETGFPVVLKGLGRNLMHKTESGLVHLHLADEKAVRAAAGKIAQHGGADLEGFLIQPHVEGKREFVAGLFRDPEYGPVVMFGLGGIFTEAFSDVAFRLAPLSRSDAEEMISEIRSAALLENFRGEAAVDRQTLIDTLVGISGAGLHDPEIKEIDINPLLVTAGGRPVAVDALVVRGKPETGKQLLPPVDPSVLGALFYPRSVAFVGASGQLGKWGYTLLTNTIGGGYQGEIYLVNPKGGEIAGRPVYKNVAEIPGSVDVAVVTIPAAKVFDLIPQFKEKGISYMLLIASGFSETGKQGAEAERRLVEEARQAGISLIGPNTMGICNPHINFYCTGSHVRPAPGSVGMVAQSGNMGNQLLAFAELQGVGIRAFCGSGNEAMITIEDYLDAFEVDSLTGTVMLYIESVKNGRRFYESARRVSRKMPIVLLKGGQTKAGTKAAASHTGAMASDTRVFNSVCRQAGIVKVDKPMDLLDLSAAFSSLPLPAGSRVAIMTLGGGWGVVAADLCEHYGLEVAELSPELIEEIDKVLPPYWSRANPVDLVGENDPDLPIKVSRLLAEWDGCDAIINLGIVGRRHMLARMADSVQKADPTCPADFMESLLRELESFETGYINHIVSLMEKHEKPILGVNMLRGEKDKTVYKVEGSSYKGLFFPTPEQAVKSLAKLWEYRRFLDTEKQD
ncbi:MAG: acetate--CoA ligase family protein [Desulfobacteraceae bacterium]|nr:acetate--CoA ligase family protein [Desulfobacteraceae bacterium]